MVFTFTDATTAAHDVIVTTLNGDGNAMQRLFVAVNATTGGFILNVKTLTGTGR
jgi:hypothetical protein